MVPRLVSMVAVFWSRRGLSGRYGSCRPNANPSPRQERRERLAPGVDRLGGQPGTRAPGRRSRAGSDRSAASPGAAGATAHRSDSGSRRRITRRGTKPRRARRDATPPRPESPAAPVTTRWVGGLSCQSAPADTPRREARAAAAPPGEGRHQRLMPFAPSARPRCARAAGRRTTPATPLGDGVGVSWIGLAGAGSRPSPRGRGAISNRPPPASSRVLPPDPLHERLGPCAASSFRP